MDVRNGDKLDIKQVNIIVAIMITQNTGMFYLDGNCLKNK